LDLPLYRLFFTLEEKPSKPPNVTRGKSLEELAEDTSPAGSEARLLLTLKGYVERMAEPDRILLLDVAKRLAAR
jgi:hypothetical protein